MPSVKRSQVVIIYSHKDLNWLNKLQTMLSPLIRSSKISLWEDTKIQAGDDWKESIDKALNSAGIAIFLVSSNFLASDFIINQELPILLNSAKRDGLVILWVAISDCLYQETAIGSYQAANDPMVPLDTMSEGEVNKELVRICKQIISVVGNSELQKQNGKKSKQDDTLSPLMTLPDFQDFFGRDSELEKLDLAIRQSSIVVVYGEPGIGKTYLAAELAKRLKQKYKIFWYEKFTITVDELLFQANEFLKAEENYSFENVYNDQDMAISIKVATLVQLIRSEQCLIFVDNFHRADKSEFLYLLERFSTHGGASRMLIIDQSPLYAELKPSLSGKIGRIEIQGLTKDEAERYIIERSRVAKIDWSENELTEVITKTDGHPLAMNLIIEWRWAGATLKDVLDRLEEYDERSGAELHQRLLDDVKRRLTDIEREALCRISVFQTKVLRAAWQYLDIGRNVGESLLQRRLLMPLGQDKFQMHPIMRKFWYAELKDRNIYHARAGQYYWEQGKNRIKDSFDLSSYLSAHHHFMEAEEPENAEDLVNELVHRLHEKDPLSSEKLSSLSSWILSLDDNLEDKPWLLFEKGRKLAEIDGRPEEAEAIFKKVKEIFIANGDAMGDSVARYYIGKAMYVQKNFDRALKAFQGALPIAKFRNDKYMQIRIWGKIIGCYANLGKYAQGTIAANMAEELAQLTGDKLDKAIILYLRGKIERCQSNFSGAANHLTICERAFGELKDVYRQSKALSRLGIVQGFQGLLAQASSNFERAIDLKKLIDDQEGLARDQDYLGDIYTFRGYYIKAQTCYKQSLSIKSCRNGIQPDVYGQIKGYNNLARLALLQGMLSEADNYLRKSAELLNKFETSVDSFLSRSGKSLWPKNKQHIGVAGTCLYHYGELKYLEGDYSKALLLYKDAAHCFKSPRYPNIPHSYAICLLGLGKIYLEMRDGGLAKAYLKKALSIFQENHIPYYEALTLSYIARLEAFIGHVEEGNTRNAEAMEIARNIGAEHVSIICLETQGIIEESRLLNSFSLAPATLDEKEVIIKEYIEAVCGFYDEAAQDLEKLKSSYHISRIKVKKYLWLLTVKMFFGEPISADDAFGLLAGPFSKEAIRLELLSARCALKNLGGIPSSLAYSLAKRALQILSPLAMRFGFNAIREDIESLAFNYRHPSKHQEIARILEERFPNRRRFIFEIKEDLQKLLENIGVKDATIRPRSKELYSIYRKQVSRKISLNEILDIVGFRIITHHEKDCYEALAAIQGQWPLFKGEGILSEPIRDYIQNPKMKTGYQSIHVNVKAKGQIVEFQIRTREMHLAAEIGFSALGLDRSAHWRYKDVNLYNHPSLLKNYDLSQRKVLAKLIIECTSPWISRIGEIIRNFRGLEIWSVDIDRVGVHKETGNPSGKRIVLRLEIGPKIRARKAQEYLDNVLNKLKDSIIQNVPDSVFACSEDDFKAYNIQTDQLPIEEKASLLFELTNLSRKYVYVLTPKGDVKKLLAGSTVLDFAYIIHTELGHRCKAARINGNWAAIDYHLKTGDKVEVITGQRDGPSSHWLDIAKTHHAKVKIRQWFRQHALDNSIKRSGK